MSERHKDSYINYIFLSNEELNSQTGRDALPGMCFVCTLTKCACLFIRVQISHLALSLLKFRCYISVGCLNLDVI